jgi:soluble lytic murein transglycosylase-like protein
MIPTRSDIEAAIRMAAAGLLMDAPLLIRQCDAESSFNPAARSSCGALGLFQLMPATAKELGVDPLDWKANIQGGVKYMAWLLHHYAGDYAKALAAYNHGVGNVDKLIHSQPEHWRECLPEETERYLDRILGKPQQNPRT